MKSLPFLPLSSSSSFDVLQRSIWQHIPWSTLVDAHYDHSSKRLNYVQQQLSLRNASSNVASKRVRQSLPTLLISSCLLGAPVTYRGTCARCVRHKFNSDNNKDNLNGKYGNSCNINNDKKKKNSSQQHANEGTVRNCTVPTPFTFFIDVICGYLCEQNYIRCIPFCPQMQLLHLPSPRPPMKLVCKYNCCSCLHECNSFEEQSRFCTSLVQSQAKFNQNSTGKVLLSWQHTQLDQLYCNVNDQSALYKSDNVAEQYLVANKNICTNKNLQSSNDVYWSRLLPVPLCQIDGIVCKARSPSCGVGDARLYHLYEQITNNKNNCLSQLNHKGNTLMPYTQCDGFFVQWLRHMYESKYNANNGNTTSPHAFSLKTASSLSSPPPPIISQLLMNNYAHVNQPSSRRTFNKCDNNVGKSLLCFMDRVLKHYEHRTS